MRITNDEACAQFARFVTLRIDPRREPLNANPQRRGIFPAPTTKPAFSREFRGPTSDKCHAALFFLDAKPTGIDAKRSGIEEKVSVIDATLSVIDAKRSGIEENVSVIDAERAGVDERPRVLDAALRFLDESAFVVDPGTPMTRMEKRSGKDGSSHL